MSTITSREFSRGVSAAKRASADGPVVITERGAPSHVLLSYAEFERLRGGHRNLADILRMPTSDDLDLNPARVPMSVREVDV